jgi:hypothetical protein
MRRWWSQHGTMILRVTVIYLVVAALEVLAGDLRRLVLEPSPAGAIDLKIFHELVYAWFAGEPVYGDAARGFYPPASYAILLPLLGWLEVPAARWLWAVTTAAMLASLGFLIVRESGADTHLERGFLVLLLLAANATGVAMGNGQLIVHLLPALLAGLLLVRQDRHRWGEDLLITGLFLAALVKPSVSLPFLLVLAFRTSQRRTVLFVAIGYLALTLFAAQFQDAALWTLLRDWLARSSVEATAAGYGNVHIWLSKLGLGEWILPASLGVLLMLGLWLYRHRRLDLWLQIGVTAIVARLWTYHRMYDDLLMLLPAVTLFRIAKQSACDGSDDVVAGVLLAMAALTLLMPARILYQWASPWPLLFKSSHVITWVIVLVFLLDYARRMRTRFRRSHEAWDATDRYDPFSN